MPPATRWTWNVLTSSSSSLSGERPKKRPNLATACTYDRCVAGDRLRTVMSSIMRRRSGLISVIGGLPSRVGVKHPNLADQPTSLRRERRLGYRVSGLVQSPQRESGFPSAGIIEESSHEQTDPLGSRRGSLPVGSRRRATAGGEPIRR